MPNKNDSLREHLSRAGSARSERKTAAARRNSRKGGAARRGKPSVVAVRRIMNYAGFIAGDYPNIAADLRRICAGQDEGEPWTVEVSE